MAYPKSVTTILRAMKTKIYIGVAALIVALSGGMFWQHKELVKVRSERNTYKSNMEGLLVDVERLETDSTMTALQVQSLNLKVGEYEKYRAEDAAAIQSLHIKLKNVQSVSKSEIDIDVPIQTIVQRDTIYLDSIVKPVQIIQYNDGYAKLDGTITEDSLKANIHIPITLMQVVHKVPKHKFLWWSWGCKAIKQVITSDNPYADIKYSEYIEIKRQ